MIELGTEEHNRAMMRVDPCYWAIRNKIKLLGGVEFTLDGCEYMADVMRDEARHIAVMKGAQARITTAFMLREIHALRYGKYPQGSIYYFPDKTAVESFSKTRFGPLLKDNRCIRAVMRSTDSVNIKRVGDAFLSLLGCKATSLIQGKKDSTAVRSTPADSVVRDERDLFDDTMADMTCDRLLNSKLKREVDLGTPTIPDIGIDRIFGQSDQKHRLIKCRSCGEYTCLASEFPNSVRYARETSHERYQPFFGCIRCGHHLDMADGEFVDKFQGREISGYHIPHFITPHCDLNLVMKDWEKANQDKTLMGTFYNKYLGFAWIDIEDRLTRQDVFNCCGEGLMASSSVTPTAMAADIMKTNRVVIAEKVDLHKTRIIHIARVTGFDPLFDLLVKFNVKSAVICLRPYEESFRKFQERVYNYDPSIKVYGSEYKDRQKILLKEDQTSGVYSVARTEIMDKSHSWVKSGNLEIPRRCREVEVFAKEACNTAKTLEVDEKTGDRIYRYRPVGDKQEHYRHCLNYLWLAIDNLTHYQGLSAPVYAAARSEYDPLTYGLD